MKKRKSNYCPNELWPYRFLKTAIKTEVPYSDVRSQHIYRKAISINPTHQTYTLLAISISKNFLKVTQSWKFLKPNVFVHRAHFVSKTLHRMMANDKFSSQGIKQMSLLFLMEMCLLHINKPKSVYEYAQRFYVPLRREKIPTT